MQYPFGQFESTVASQPLAHHWHWLLQWIYILRIVFWVLILKREIKGISKEYERLLHKFCDGLTG